MEKSKKLKIFIGLVYLLFFVSFMVFLFSKFSIGEVTSYKFIQLNRDYFSELKESNLIILSIIFLVVTTIWVFLLGFGSPVALLGGFIFGKWFGILIVSAGLSMGATFLYILGNFFLKDFIKEKFLLKYQNLELKFKQNEFSFFLLYRFIGGIPFQISNLLPVLFNVSVRNYLLGTFIGITPQLFIMVSLGSGIESIIEKNDVMPSISEIIFSQEIYIPVISFFALLILTFILRKLFYKFKK